MWVQNLVDLFDESKQPQKKLEPLEKLVAIFREYDRWMVGGALTRS